MNLQLLRKVALAALIVKAAPHSFINYYGNICPWRELLLLTAWFLILKNFPFGWCWWTVVSTSYRNSQRSLILPLHSADQLSNRWLKVTGTVHEHAGNGWGWPRFFPRNDCSCHSTFQWSFDSCLLYNPGPPTSPHFCDSKHASPQIPFLLKIVKVCFRHMSVRVLTGNRWLSQTGNWRWL